ncbi:MAG: LysM peptidoglycan-binding domain-containing protein [Desulfobulbaceae bacterium]|nr:LysM peptidoglycan-binding domain-containing protein [Desulfobulbaceae bacterium]
MAALGRRFGKISVADLLSENDLENPSKIFVGQVLTIPRPDPTPDGLVVGSFDVTSAEQYEGDPEKIGFAKDLKELKDRWRKILKMQVISQYLDLDEEREKELEKGSEAVSEVAEKSETVLWHEAIAKVKKRNNTFFQRLRQETLQDHYDRFFNCVTRAFGPHTNYIAPASKEQFDINMRGSLEGIGALLREDDGFIKVVRIIPGSASARQGRLKAEDIILEVAQEGEEPVDITEMRLRDAVRLIRGPKGEAVSLTVKKSDGAKETIRIIRDVVQIEETFVKSTVLESENGQKTGYLFIPSFYRDFEGSRNGGTARNSTDDTRKEIQKLKEQFVDGLILDLRDDGGGALVDAVDITGLFIESGPVVQVKNSFGDRRVLSDKNGSVYYDGPLVVLVNKFSASASEIVAAALQDYKRAVIVGGIHTHGKGTVQTIVDLNENIPLLHMKKYDDLGALKVMIQKFYRVNGSSTQYKGVEPDIVLPNLFEHIKSGERYLDYSLPWDSIDAVEFTPWSGKSFDLDTIVKRSKERSEKDEGISTIREEAVKAAARSEDTIVTIQLADMRQKRAEAERTREKVGVHYRKYRDEEAGSVGDGQGKESEEDPKETWLKEVNEDPYIREAVSIVGDLIKISK